MTHAEAADIIREAWRRIHGRSPTEKERVYAQAIAALETGYGRAGQFGVLASRGQFNWGALETRRRGDGTCPAGTAAGSDQGPVCFYAFPSDVEAATAFVRTLTTKHWPVVEAMRGSPTDVARAMRTPPPYYTGTAQTEEGKIGQYAAAIEGKVRAITGSPSSSLPSATSSLAVWVLAAGAAGLGWYAYQQGYFDEAGTWMRRVFR